MSNKGKTVEQVLREAFDYAGLEYFASPDALDRPRLILLDHNDSPLVEFVCPGEDLVWVDAYTEEKKTGKYYVIWDKKGKRVYAGCASTPTWTRDMRQAYLFRYPVAPRSIAKRLSAEGEMDAVVVEATLSMEVPQ